MFGMFCCCCKFMFIFCKFSILLVNLYHTFVFLFIFCKFLFILCKFIFILSVHNILTMPQIYLFWKNEADWLMVQSFPKVEQTHLKLNKINLWIFFGRCWSFLGWFWHSLILFVFLWYFLIWYLLYTLSGLM